ncbi:Serine/threonine kinase [Pyrenophora teres f. maculata]|nr:Serine/threonine kinase [Pyrenophora teres f. maculata]
MPQHQRNEGASSKGRVVSYVKNDLVLVDSLLDGDIMRATFRSLRLGGLWYAETKMTRSRKPDTNPFYWDAPPRKIDMQVVRPTYKAAEMTRAKFSSRDRLFLKEANMLRYANLLFGGLVRIKDIVLREIKTCEILRRHPHPNICRYKGVDYNKHLEVTGLVFDRYDANLRDFVLNQHLFDVGRCIQDIWEGIAHMHSLGLVHCDIKPCNILVDIAAQRFVIGDFDSTHKNGAPLEIKWGTEGWTPRVGQTDGRAAVEIDLYAFDMLKAWIKAKGNGNPVKGSRYMRTREILEGAKKQIESQNERRRNIQFNLGAVAEGSHAQVYRANFEVPREMQSSVSPDPKRAEAKQIRGGDDMHLRFYR